MICDVALEDDDRWVKDVVYKRGERKDKIIRRQPVRNISAFPFVIIDPIHEEQK
jgi:hypothetical protein